MPNRKERKQSATTGGDNFGALHLAIRDGNSQQIEQVIDASVPGESRRKVLAIALFATLCL